MNIDSINELDGLDFAKSDGLIPAVIQDYSTAAVLMVGYMNREALEQTMTTGRVVFWSRSRQQLWLKGETSGNYLQLVSVRADCDTDTLLIQAEPDGPTCHKGAYSCFGVEARSAIFLQQLYELIEQRQKELPANSYTTSLFNAGLNQIMAKVEEEAGEVLHAAAHETHQRLVEESGDLLFHLLVLLARKGVTLDQVMHELQQRNRRG